MAGMKDACPSCDGLKDVRAEMCHPCRVKNKPARLGTGKKWHIHKRSGYIIRCWNGQRLYQHRYVMEQHLGRKLMTDEHVHHKDGNKTNNELSNLELIGASDHGRHHIQGRAREMSMKAQFVRWGYVPYV